MHSRCPGFQTRRCYGVENRGQPGPRRSDDGKRRTESGYTVLKQRLPESGAGDFNVFQTTTTHRQTPGAKKGRLIPGHRRRSSDMIRISTVRPPGKPIENPV